MNCLECSWVKKHKFKIWFDQNHTSEKIRNGLRKSKNGRIKITPMKKSSSYDLRKYMKWLDQIMFSYHNLNKCKIWQLMLKHITALDKIINEAIQTNLTKARTPNSLLISSTLYQWAMVIQVVRYWNNLNKYDNCKIFDFFLSVVALIYILVLINTSIIRCQNSAVEKGRAFEDEDESSSLV